MFLALVKPWRLHLRSHEPRHLNRRREPGTKYKKYNEKYKKYKNSKRAPSDNGD